MKVCKGCKVEKSLDQFHAHRKVKDGKRSQCKLCTRTTSQVYRAKNLEKRKAYNKLWDERNPGARRNLELKRAYGITLEDYNKRLLLQKGLCAICQVPEGMEKRRLHIDHNHKTNKIRGILCVRCNQGLGSFRDSSLFLFKAIRYLAEAGE